MKLSLQEKVLFYKIINIFVTFKLFILIYILFSIYIHVIQYKNFKYYMFTIKQK